MKKLMAAGGLFQRGEYDMAAEEYAEFLKKYPQHAQAANARYGLAICRYHKGKYAEAAAELTKVLADAKFTKRDEALAVLGHCQLSTQAYAAALATFDKLLAEHAGSKHAEVASLNRAQVLYLVGKKAESLAACQAFLKAYPNSMRLAAAKYFLALAQESLGKHAEAEAVLTKLLADYPNNPYELDGTLLLGQSLEGQDKLDKAAEQYAKFLKAAGPDRRGEGHYSLGVVHYKAGKYDESIKGLSEVLAKHGKSRYAAPARLQLGLAQLAAEKTAEARKTLQEVVKSDEARAPTARYWLAQCDMAEKKYQAARATLDALAALKPPPDNLEAVAFDRAVCAMALDDHEQAAKEFQAFLEAYPKSERRAEAIYRRAFCVHKLGRYAESIELCRQAKVTGAKLKASLAELSAENLFLMGKYPEAQKAFAALAETAKKADEKLRIRFRLGQCAYFAEDYPKAVELLSKVAAAPSAAKSEELRESIFLLGDAQLQAGQHAQAAKTLARYLNGAKRHQAEGRFKLGLAQLRAGQAEAAGKSFAAVMDAGGDSPWVLRATFEYGQLAYKNKQPEEAAKALSKVVSSKAPAELAAPAKYLLAWIDFDAKKYAEAAAGFAAMLKAHPDHALAPEATFQHAVALKEAGQTEPALKALQAFLKAHPEDKHAPEARHLVGSCMAELGRHDEAAAKLKALAANKATCSDTVLYELAWSQRSTEDTEAAVATYNRLLKEYPDSKLVTPARAELAELLYQQKKYDEAVKLLQQVVGAKAEPKTLSVATYLLGSCHEKLKQPKEAAETFSAFASKYPSDELAASALYRSGVAYTEQEKLPEAAKQFSALLAKHADHDLAAVTHVKLGQVQNSLGEPEKAAATFTAYLKKHGKHRYAYLAHFGMGWALQSQKKYAEARQWYEKVTDAHNGPTAARAQFQIGETYFDEQKLEQAVRELLKVTSVYAYPQWCSKALLEAGRAYTQLKQIDKARKSYAECASKYKDRPEGALARKQLAALGG